MDLSIYETGNGGDIAQKGNDLELVNGLLNQPYLSMFGGNVEQSHGDQDEFEERVERFDFWGNQLLFPNDKQQQFNSEIERAIQEIPVTSQGRFELTQLLKEDLRHLDPAGVVEAEIVLNGHERTLINVIIKEPGKTEVNEFKYLWDGLRLEDTKRPPIDKDKLTPPTPTLTINPWTETQLNLEWTDLRTNEVSFELWYSEEGGPFELLITLPANTTSYEHTGLTQGTTHYYKVRGIGINGEIGEFSNIDSFELLPWVMSGGVWNDDGIWYDGMTWED